MTTRFRLEQITHDLRTSLFLRPAIITIVLAAASILLVEADQRFALPLIALVDDPSAAQALLGIIAGSVMAVVSIVYSVLVMSLTMASMQFSPRILARFLRDPISQNVLGIFTGTFLYSLLTLRGVKTSPPLVPSLAIAGSVVLALASIASLIYFINHMAREIQVNYLVDRIAHDAAAAIDHEMPHGPGVDTPMPPATEAFVPARAEKGGYIQLIDIAGLAALAREHHLRIDVAPHPGDFVPSGGILARIAGPASDAITASCVRAFDLGPTRTLQQDVGFGFRQIVDIGLKAISPAVNDPSTCSTCVDHLGDLLCRAAKRTAGPHVIRDGDSVRLVIPAPSFQDLVDLAFNQLRQYGRGDLAVANRIMHALMDVAAATENDARRDAVLQQARLLMQGLSPTFAAEDRVELEARYAQLLG